MARILAWGALALAVASACGSSDSGTPAKLPDCSLKAAFTGDISVTGDGSALACADTNNPPGPTTAVITFAVPPATVSLSVDNLSEGATGDFPASLFIGTDTPSAQWSTLAGACTVTIQKATKVDEHGTVRVYEVVGKGTCAGDAGPAQALPVSGEAKNPITLGDFTFTARVGWTS